jgi:hypothetical protein
MLIRVQPRARRYELIYHYIPTAALPYQLSLSSLVLQGSIIIWERSDGLVFRLVRQQQVRG